MNQRGAHHGRTGGLNPRKTAFDMSHEFKGTCEFGRGIPTMCEEVYSGEFWDLSVQSLIRMHPQVAPLLHQVNITFHDFFVPARILWDDTEEYFTGGQSGTEADDKGLTWPTVSISADADSGNLVTYLNQPGSLWDYIYGNWSHYKVPATADPDAFALQPIDAPMRCYWKIWNDYYRDENFEPRKGEGTVSNSKYDPELLYDPTVEYFTPFMRNWTKDYFTSALPFQQRGTAPAFPITLEDAPVVFDNVTTGPPITSGTPFTTADPNSKLSYNISIVGSGAYTMNATSANPTAWGNPSNNVNGWQTNNPYSLMTSPARVSSTASLNSFDVTYLRYAVQIQKILERNARGGVRFNEWLYGHFGDRPRDERLQRPEYIGGARAALSISEVLQTSASNSGTDPSRGETPQGTMAGHAMAFAGQSTGKYRVRENGYIMRIMTIMPTPAYEDGIERMWFRRNRYDHLMPELVNLSEQAILNQEIFATGGPDDITPWGYQPQYDELRIRRNRTCGELRVNLPTGIPSLGYWTLTRAFDQLPTLGKEFINYDGPQLTDRIMAVSGVHPVIFSVGNVARAVRPLPYIGEPGLVDHH